MLVYFLLWYFLGWNHSRAALVVALRFVMVVRMSQMVQLRWINWFMFIWVNLWDIHHYPLCLIISWVLLRIKIWQRLHTLITDWKRLNWKHHRLFLLTLSRTWVGHCLKLSWIWFLYSLCTLTQFFCCNFLDLSPSGSGIKLMVTFNRWWVTV